MINTRKKKSEIQEDGLLAFVTTKFDAEYSDTKLF